MKLDPETVKERSLCLLAPVSASFLTFIFTVVWPLSRLGGEYAIHCYTALLLFFFPGGSVSAQLAATFNGVMFAAAGLAWSCGALAVAAYCNRTYGVDCDPARAVLAMALASVAFVGGIIRSSCPGLVVSFKASVFFPIFLLTSSQDVITVTASDFLHQFLVVIFAASFALISTVVFSRAHLQRMMRDDLVQSLRLICELLPTSYWHAMHDGISNARGAHDDLDKPKSPQGSEEELSSRLKNAVHHLATTWNSSLHETIRSRVQPSSIAPIISALQAVCRNPVLGHTKRVPGQRIRTALDRVRAQSSRPASGFATPRDRSRTEMESIDVRDLAGRLTSPPLNNRHSADHMVGIGYHIDETKLAEESDALVRNICIGVSICAAAVEGSRQPDIPAPRDRVQMEDTRRHLATSISSFESVIASVIDADESTSIPTSHTPRNPRPRRDDRHLFRTAFCVTSLLDLAQDVVILIDAVESAIATSSSRKQWHLPPVRTWITARTRQISIHTSAKKEPSDVEVETEEGVEDPMRDSGFVQNALRTQHHALIESRTVYGRLHRFWRMVWDQRGVLRGRIMLSRCLHILRHSRHILFALKFAGGISLLSIPAFMPPDNGARVWFRSFRGGWIIASFTYVMDVHTGAIMRTGTFRIVGTFIGAIVGYACTQIAHDNPYGLVVLATACSIPIAYIIQFTSFPGIGTVTGITLSPLLFIEYQGLLDGNDSLYLSWTRFVGIAIGIVTAILIGTLVWPDHARVRYLLSVSITLQRLTEYFLQMSKDNLRSSLVYQNDRERYTALENAVRSDIVTARTLVAIQRNEFSLLPRPFKLYADIVEASDRLIDALAEVRLIRFSVPRKETVLDVIPFRRELVSAILINIWASSQAFRSRSPLPQFLPDMRAALVDLMDAVDQHTRELRRRPRSRLHSGNTGGVPFPPSPSVSPGQSVLHGEGKEQLAILYSMAENEALMEVCGIVEELVAAARTLFGSQTFLSTVVRQPLPPSM